MSLPSLLPTTLSNYALETGGNLASILTALNSILSLTTKGPYDYYSLVTSFTGAGTDVTTVAGGGAGSDYWVVVADGVYELRVDPNWTGGASDSDTVRGVFQLGATPTGDDDGWYIRTGERARIHLAAGSSVYVRAHNLGVAGRWKLRRCDA